MGTVLRLSHAIQEIGNRLIILLLGLKATTVDSTGELATLGGCFAGVTTLIDDLLSVGVVCHVTIIGTGLDGLGVLVCHLANRPLAAAEFVLLKDDTVVYTFYTPSCGSSNLFYKIITIICLPNHADVLISNVAELMLRKIIMSIIKIKLDVSNLKHHAINPPEVRGSILYILRSTHARNTYHNPP